MSKNKTWAYVAGGLVINVAIADSEHASSAPFPYDHLIDVTEIKRRPGPGWTYNETDGFRPPQPFPSWTWSGNLWSPPKPAPTDPGRWIWDESTGDWVNTEASTEAE